MVELMTNLQVLLIKLQGAYKPIAEPIWKPPSDEIESLLFGLQTATDAIIIGYFLGYYRTKNRFESDFGIQRDKKLQRDEKIQTR